METQPWLEFFASLSASFRILSVRPDMETFPTPQRLIFPMSFQDVMRKKTHRTFGELARREDSISNER